MLVLKGILGGSLKITSEKKNFLRQRIASIKSQGITMLGANLSDQIPGGPNLTLTLTLNSN